MTQEQLITCYIGLGSNLGDARDNLKKALRLLGAARGVSLQQVASFYRTEPWGYTQQDHFVNTAAKIATKLPPLALLDTLQQIENQLGRVRTVRWGPRTVDLDLLLYGEEQIDTPRLVVPHPRMAQRAFVLVPLAQLNGGLVIQGENIKDLARRLAREQAIEPLPD